jgi:hypothetical protein
MNIERALHALWAALYEATEDQARDLADILHLGAGIPPLPPGAVMDWPTDLPADRRPAYCALAEAVVIQEELWRPIYAGEWEDVLATLVIGRDWDRISSTARDLRAAAARRSAGEADR